MLLEHEQRYWTRVADRFGIVLAPATRRCLVAVATLWGAADAAHARRVLTAVLPGAQPDVVGNVGDWLATLYRDGGRYWSGLQPDPLGEYLIGATLDPTRGDCSGLLRDTRGEVSAAQLEHALTVLGRAYPQHPHLADAIVDIITAGGTDAAAAAIAVAPRLEQALPLLNALDQLIDTADLAGLQDLYDAMPRFSLLLGPTITKVAESLVTLQRAATETDRDAYLPALAGSVNNLAIRLGEVGRRAEGLAAATEAVDLRRELAELNRDAYLPALAMSVNNLAVDLAEVGRRAEGLAAATEAVDLYRELARHAPDLYGPRVERAEALMASLAENDDA